MPFFLAHQDSEKDDSMIGTLVVTLPSSYAGGELMVGHNEEWKAYRGSKTALSLVAFYADCRHEVLKVQSGSLGHGPVTQAQHNRNRPEGHAEPRAGFVRRARVIYVGPAHLQILGGQAQDRVREFHGRDAVHLQ